MAPVRLRLSARLFLQDPLFLPELTPEENARLRGSTDTFTIARKNDTYKILHIAIVTL